MVYIEYLHKYYEASVEFVYSLTLIFLSELQLLVEPVAYVIR